MSLAVLLSLLEVLSGPQEMEDVLALLKITDFDSNLLPRHVQDRNSFQAISCCPVQDMRSATTSSPGFPFHTYQYSSFLGVLDTRSLYL